MQTLYQKIHSSALTLLVSHKMCLMASVDTFVLLDYIVLKARAICMDNPACETGRS